MNPPKNMQHVDLVCISHLWWSWVWQRPQHLMSRLAQQYRVFWTEEPHLEIGPTGETFELTEQQHNLLIGRLMLRSDADTFWTRLGETIARVKGKPLARTDHIREASYLFGSPVQARLEREVRDFVASWRRGPLVLWLYTPVVIDFIDILQPDLVVYDVMDELSAFKYGPPQLKEQERELLQRADLIFTGGPSLYEARKDLRPEVYLFPSGVEQHHFAQALKDDLPLPESVQSLKGPIIGFYGVIDERIDLDLLADVAARRPDWNWVMIGPILKIADEDLPRLPNIHYLGKQEYKDLPTFLKGFDVAMMPFALNESTRFISPTKTLEYMAAHKPIVSTPIKDVSSLYGEVVSIASTAEEFVEAIERALAEPPSVKQERMQKENDLLQRYEWDTIAGEMHRIIQDRLSQKLGAQQAADRASR